MSDLRIDDATAIGASAGLRGAANQLSSVIRAVQALDTGVAGVNAPAGRCQCQGTARCRSLFGVLAPRLRTRTRDSPIATRGAARTGAVTV